MNQLMRRYLFIIALLTSLLSMAATPFQVMTFNVRLDVAGDGANAWSNRKDHVGLMLNYYAPELIGMQEVTPGQLSDLRAMLSGYGQVGVGRDNGKDAGEHCPIFYDTSRFVLVDNGDFALNATSEWGVKGWDASYNRVATWVILDDKATGKRLAYVNTHLDNDGHVARVEGMRLVMEKMSQVAAGLPLIITGDFNCTDDAPLKVLAQAGMRHTRDISHIVYGPAWTWHDFGREPMTERVLIDYIFVSNHFGVERYRTIADTYNDGFWPSDHLPVITTVTL